MGTKKRFRAESLSKSLPPSCRKSLSHQWKGGVYCNINSRCLGIQASTALTIKEDSFITTRQKSISGLTREKTFTEHQNHQLAIQNRPFLMLPDSLIIRKQNTRMKLNKRQ